MELKNWAWVIESFYKLGGVILLMASYEMKTTMEPPPGLANEVLYSMVFLLLTWFGVLLIFFSKVEPIGEADKDV